MATLLFRPRKQVHLAIPLALLVAAALKLFLAPMLVPEGWRGVYQPARGKPDATYEPFRPAYFQDGLVARPYRVDRAIAFEGVNFGLTYINDRPESAVVALSRLDYYTRKRDVGDPLIVRWTGYLATDTAKSVSPVISASGGVTISVNGREVFRATNPRQRAVSWDLTPGIHPIQIVYRKPPDVVPAITVLGIEDVTPVAAPSDAIRRSGHAATAIYVVGLLVLALLGLAFLRAYSRVTRFFFEDVWLETDKVVVLVLFAAFFVGGIAAAIPTRNATIQLSIGDDPLAYAGAARAILRNGILLLDETGPKEPYYFYPMYSYVLAAAHVLWGDDYATIVILNMLCAGAVIVLVWMILRHRLARGALVFVLLLFAIFAKNHFLRWTHQPFTDNLFVPAVMGTILATIIAFETKKSRWLFVVGVLTALSAAIRPSMLLHLPVMALGILLYRDLGTFRKRFTGAATFVFGFAVGVAPFTLRNWIVSKRFVLLVASFVMLPFFMIPPGDPGIPLMIGDAAPNATQAIGQAWFLLKTRPLQVALLEIKKTLFTFGIMAAGPEIVDPPLHFPIFPILFVIALYKRRIDRAVAAALLIFGLSHLLGLIVGTPWTYGYKTILPFHVTAIIGAAFLLPRRGELYSIPTPRERRVPGPLADRTVSVVLPTYNEKDSIRRCIQDFFATGVVDEVLVINNNAAPGTSEEVAGTGAIEIFEPRQGYGSAIQRGLREAKGDYIVVCEPDGTFVPGDIHKLLAYAEDFDVVYGSRTSQQMVWKGANMGMFLRWGNWVVAKYLEFLYNATSLTDVGCTMRLVSREAALSLLPKFRISGSQFGPEMMILSLREGFHVIQIPVNYLPRVGESAVTGDPAKAFRLGLQMLWLITTRRLAHLNTVPPLTVQETTHQDG